MPSSTPELLNGLLGMSIIISVADNVELVRKKAISWLQVIPAGW